MHRRTIFLSYAKEDRRRVLAIYRALKHAGLSPWMDAPPRPWHLEGIPPAADWDVEIRRHMAESDLVLIFLSSRSVQKKGYFQKEYRFALSLAAERPPTSLYLLPVLLERCAVPDVTVDTVCLRRFQWHPHYKSTMRDLVSWVEKAVRSKQGERQTLSASSSTADDTMETVLRISESMRRKPSDSSIARREPSQLIVDTIAGLIKNDEEQIRYAAWPGSLSDVVVDWDRATNGLLRMESTPTAVGVSLLLAAVCLGRRNDQDALRSLKRWHEHSSPEVRAMAAFVLCQRARPASEYYRAVEDYAPQSGRPYRFHRIVRHMLDRDALPGMIRHAPTMAWRIVGNDPHIAGMQMRYLSFHDKRGTCRRLLRSRIPQQREVAAAVACADETVPLTEKLPLLADPVPRVRFRALEAILHCHEQRDLSVIMNSLHGSSPLAQGPSTFTVRFDASDTGGVVFLKDASCRIPAESSFWGSSTDYILVESLDEDACTLEAVAYINVDAEEAVDILNTEYQNVPPPWALDCPLQTRLDFMRRLSGGEQGNQADGQ